MSYQHTLGVSGGLGTAMGVLHSVANNVSHTLGVESCPSSNGSTIPFPSTFVLCCVGAVVCCGAAILVLQWYNCLLLVEDGSITEKTAVYTPLTSNTHWGMYFALVSLKYTLNAIMYGEDDVVKNKTALAYMNYADLVMHSLTCLALSWALLYQLKHRSGQDIDVHSDTHTDSSGDPGRKVVRLLTSTEAGLLYLSLLHCLVAWWAVPDRPGNDNYDHAYWVFVGALCTQRLPQYVIGVLLVLPSLDVKVAHHTSRFNPNSYPSTNARWILGVGLLLAMPHSLPATTWTLHIMTSANTRHPCPLGIFSWYDIMLLMYMASLMCYFSFLRLEFNRVKEQELYTCHVEHAERSDNRRVL